MGPLVTYDDIPIPTFSIEDGEDVWHTRSGHYYTLESGNWIGQEDSLEVDFTINVDHNASIFVGAVRSSDYIDNQSDVEDSPISYAVSYTTVEETEIIQLISMILVLAILLSSSRDNKEKQKS